MTTQEIIEQTKQLIAIPSTADRPKELLAAVDFVADIVSQHKGITIERFEQGGKHSFLAYRKGPRPEKFDILLNAHVDVVPGAPETFKPYVKDGRLYGRGALDMKGTTLTLTDVFCELVNEVPYNLGLQIVSDEEIGGYNGVRMHIDDLGVRANFVIMGEYANDRHTIYNAARGLCWAEIAFKGKAAHGGHLWNGTNAVVKAGSFAGAVLQRYPTPDKETWTTTASISNLSTPNDAYNKVPDSAVLKIDFRFTQEDPVFSSRESFIEFIHELDPDAELINTATFEPAVHVDQLNPYVQGMTQALKAVTGKQPQFLGRPASSDGRHFALVNNDIVEFGLYGQGSHSDNEYVEIASFAEYQQTLQGFLRKPIPDNLLEPEDNGEVLHEQLLRKLVEIPSVTNDFAGNNKIFDFIKEFLTTRGMHVEQMDVNGFRSLVATTKKGNKRPTVVLNAHTDTVPGTDNMYKLTLKDGKFYGRGVMDMKHAIAAYLTAVDLLKDDLANLDFGLMITSDEEVGSSNGAKKLVEMGYGGKVVVIPDGGNNWKLETFAKGVKWAKLDAYGKTAHASRPWEGESAIQRLLGAIHEIEGLVPKNPTPQDTLMTLGTINGGITANQIPAHATATLDIRPGSVADHLSLTPAIEEICARHEVTVEFQSNEPPCVTDPNDPWVKPMTDIVEQITGRKHDTSYDFAVTDGRIFSAAGMSTIVINPECGNIHREDEWLGRESFADFCTAIEMYVRKMAKIPQEEPAKDEYVWYATFGSGLWKEHFLHSIIGDKPGETLRHNTGCTDKSAPIKDSFMSLPYKLFFAGRCQLHDDGGHAFIDYRKDESAHTVARAYLITRQQFAEIVAQENLRTSATKLPYEAAIKRGHASIHKGTGDYDELLYCGTKDGYPVFSITTPNPDVPYAAPSTAYTEMLCNGLSDVHNADREQAIDYLMSIPGVSTSHNVSDIKESLKQAQNRAKH